MKQIKIRNFWQCFSDVDRSRRKLIETFRRCDIKLETLGDTNLRQGSWSHKIFTTAISRNGKNSAKFLDPLCIVIRNYEDPLFVASHASNPSKNFIKSTTFAFSCEQTNRERQKHNITGGSHKLGGGYNYNSTRVRLQFDRVTRVIRPTIRL